MLAFYKSRTCTVAQRFRKSFEFLHLYLVSKLAKAIVKIRVQWKIVGNNKISEFVYLFFKYFRHLKICPNN